MSRDLVDNVIVAIKIFGLLCAIAACVALAGAAIAVWLAFMGVTL